LIRTFVSQKPFDTQKAFFTPGLPKTMKRLPLEAIVWTTGLVLLATLESGSNHFSLCPLKLAGFTWCPGCGLGNSIALLFYGKFTESFNAHPLGIFALVILSFRIISLTKLYVQNYGKSY
jgi:hypothetical protein